MRRLKYFFILLFLTHSVLVDGKSSYANKIKHVVVLMEENRSFDHMMGWFKGKEYNQVNVSDPASPKVYVGSNAPFVAPCDPTHSTPGTTFKIYASESDAGEALMGGFVEYEDRAGHANTNYCAVMEMQSPSHLPIMSSLASEFVVMDRFFCAHPGPTWPNRLFMLSATSAGDTETKTFYQDKEGHLYPQKTIFNQVSEAGLQWKNYFNDTPWELFLETIVLHPENLFNMEKFYEDAKTGDLPAFSWINPRTAINITLKQGSNDQHPDHDVTLGERYYKDIYEALRASPAWNDTLYIITYDEHGGFYDHVVPPVNVPAPDNSTSYPDKDFLFNRLGVRIPTLLISPWLPQGLVESAPPDTQKPYNNSEYSLTSIMATARILLGMPNNPLTMRDKWSATFEHLFEILDSPRTDCPLHLPDAPPPAKRGIEEEDLPINDLQKTIMEMHANLAGVDFPTNVVKQGQVSEWLQAQYSKHVDNTFNWKRHKTSLSQFSISSQPLSSNYSHSSHWRVNKGTHYPYFTLSTRGAMCLDFKEREIGISPCYPREDADSSLDHSQRWIWGDNLSLRPFSLSLSQCLTRESDGVIGLSKCDGRKEQKWNWEESSCGEKSEMGEIRWFDSDERVVIR